MTTLLISGSRDASEQMLAYARACVASARGAKYFVICGDAFGIDWQVITECQRLGLDYMSYGIKDYPRNGALKYTKLDVENYAARDRWMVEHAEKVMCITTKEGTPGTLAVYEYAVKLGKECWLKRDL